MPLTAIDRLKQTVTEEWTSPVADQVAADWGYEPGTAKWWRSSASHVFVLPDPRGKRFLRFVPDAQNDTTTWAATARLMARLAARGAAVARPVEAESGELTTTVHTELGVMHAMVVEAAPGDQIDIDDLTAESARSWGRALAAIHRNAADGDADLPEPFGELAEVHERFADDPALVKAAARLAERLDGLPRDAARFGVVHGDFELDNLAWDRGRATAFDFDEAAPSWYAADIAFALRDLTGPTGEVADGRQELFAGFIAGYRSIRSLDASELTTLRLFTGVHAVCSLVRIARAMGASHGAEAQWLTELRTKLAVMAQEHRDLAVAVAEAE
jgi:Ser/Thr protein kinase RdoA (MazF antagonist)